MEGASPVGPEGEEERGADSGDDAVIGRALRASIWLVLTFGLLAVLGWWALRPRETPVGDSLVAPAPQIPDREESMPDIRFTDVTAEAGIDFVHRNGAYGAKLLPETMGGGVAFFDPDGDGDPDLLFVGSSRWPESPEEKGGGEPPSLALYANDGTGSFTDITRQSGLDLVLYGMGPAVADFDGDGDEDLFLTAVGPNRLLRNDGGRFVDHTQQAGVAGEAEAWSTGATFADIDRDGDLDLFVCNYVRWSPEIDFRLDFRLDGIGRAYGPPQSYGGTVPYLYRNDGDGTFTDITEESGVALRHPVTGEPMAKALAVLPVDIDEDGLVDFLVANDTVRNFFFHNLGGGRFEEMGEAIGLAYDRNGNATGAMGLDSAFHRNSADRAFAVGNFANEMSSIYVSQGDPFFFVDEAIAEGVGAASRRPLTFAVLFFDADLDGRQDFVQVNGHIEGRIAGVDSAQSFEQPGQLFWNRGLEGFVEHTSIGDLADPLVGRGAAHADIDGDGDLDLAIAVSGGPARLLRNDQATENSWLKVRLVGRAPNTAALGAIVELTVGGNTQRREIWPTRGYLSHVFSQVTFGLAHDSANSLFITWPDGQQSQFVDLKVSQVLEVEQP